MEFMNIFVRQRADMPFFLWEQVLERLSRPQLQQRCYMLANGWKQILIRL